jgi:uncharacterized protein (TIGR03435 family)
MTLMFFVPAAEHVLESTAFLLCAWGFAALLSRHAAAVRYRLWLAASLKFIVPLAPLVAIGRRFAWRTAPLASGGWLGNLNTEAMPTAAGHAVATTAAHAPAAGVEITTLVIAVWAAGTLLLLARWCAGVVRVRRTLRQAVRVDARTFGTPEGVRTLAVPWPCEPAIVGVWRPALVLPADIASHLTADQLASVIAHELSHLRRRDNLAAAVHMLVEAIFWFHPGVWLIERRLVDERERACDESVIAACVEPETYAEAILQVCRRYIRAPTLVHAAVTGASLRERVERILRSRPVARVSAWWRAALVSGAALVVALPLAAGAATGTAASADQSATRPEGGDRLAFEVASIKPVPSTMPSGSWRYAPGRMTGTFSPRLLIALAFGTPERISFPPQQIVGGPDWLDTERFAINATAAVDGEFDISVPYRFGRPIAPYLRSLLEDRFKLAAHIEKRDFPVYALIVARSDGQLGPRLRRSTLTDADCQSRREHPSPDARPCGAVLHVGDPLTGVPVERAIGFLQSLDRIVLDRTGLGGLFDIDFKRDDTISIFTDVQEQLGLKLEPTREPLDALVIDHLERPTRDE